MASEEQGFPFAFAALKAGVTAKALRGWLDRDQVHCPSLSVRDPGEWRRFTSADVLHLAIVRTIIKYDFRIEFADKVAAQITTQIGPSGSDFFQNVARWERLKNITVRIRHAQGDGDPEIMPQANFDDFGGFLEIRPYQIWREINSDPFGTRVLLENPALLLRTAKIELAREKRRKDRKEPKGLKPHRPKRDRDA